MSLLKTLFTTVAALVFIAVAGFVAYVAYSIFVDIKTQTEKKLQKKNVIFTKDGMKVGVKEVTTEKTIDSTQKYVSPRSFLSAITHYLRSLESCHNPNLVSYAALNGPNDGRRFIQLGRVIFQCKEKLSGRLRCI